MFGITTGERIKIGVDSLWCKRIADILIKSQMVDSEGLWACP